MNERMYGGMRCSVYCLCECRSFLCSLLASDGHQTIQFVPFCYTLTARVTQSKLELHIGQNRWHIPFGPLSLLVSSFENHAKKKYAHRPKFVGRFDTPRMQYTERAREGDTESWPPENVAVNVQANWFTCNGGHRQNQVTYANDYWLTLTIVLIWIFWFPFFCVRCCCSTLPGSTSNRNSRKVSRQNVDAERQGKLICHWIYLR